MKMPSEKNRRPEWVSHIPMSRSMSIFVVVLIT